MPFTLLHRALITLLLAAIAVVPSKAAAQAAPRETAVLAGGCFWGMEAVFEHVRGVTNVVSGYAGGSAAQANYAAVSSERTGHAEAVRISYDPRQVSYEQLLRVYAFAAHDPTQLNRQGPDTGPSYRSAIFPQNASQAAAARNFVSRLRRSGLFRQPVVTRIESGRFYPAEASHQDFMRRNPVHPYILAHDRPKLVTLKKRFPQLYRG